MLFWAFSFVWTKVAFESFPPMTLVLCRLVLSTLLMGIILKAGGWLNKLERRDWKQFLLLALFEPFLYFIGESHGLKQVSSTMGAVVVATIPVFAPIAGYFIFKERFTLMHLLAIALSFTGVVILIFQPDFTLDAPLSGIVLLFLAVFSAIGYSSILKMLPERYNVFSIITYQNLIGTLYFIPVVLIFDRNDFSFSQVTFSSLRALVMLAVFASSLAFILFSYAVRKVGIVTSNIWVNTIPVFTAIIAYFVLGETLTLQKAIGMAVVIGGVLLTQIKFRKPSCTTSSSTNN